MNIDDPELSYRRHLQKWGPLIESNDPLIYSEWDNFTQYIDEDPYYSTYSDEFRTSFILQNAMVANSIYPLNMVVLLPNGKLRRPGGDCNSRIAGADGLKPIRDERMRELLLDQNVRYSIIKLLYTSYIDCIENRLLEDNWNRDTSFLARFSPKGFSKYDIIEFIERTDRTGNNPFDIVYYYCSSSYKWNKVGQGFLGFFVFTIKRMFWAFLLLVILFPFILMLAQ